MVSGTWTVTGNHQIWLRCWYVVSWMHLLWTGWRKDLVPDLIWNRTDILDFVLAGNAQNGLVDGNCLISFVQSKYLAIKAFFPQIYQETERVQVPLGWRSRPAVEDVGCQPSRPDRNYLGLEPRIFQDVSDGWVKYLIMETISFEKVLRKLLLHLVRLHLHPSVVTKFLLVKWFQLFCLY